MSKVTDPFAKVPEFLAAFANIRDNGFFENLEFHISGVHLEGRIMFCSINVSGCVPSEEQYAAAGCGALVDPESIITSARSFAETQAIKDVTAEVKTENWSLWDEGGEEIIGSKGTRTTMCLIIVFEL